MKFTLHQAKKSNPSKICILLGDKLNKSLALKYGWKHIDSCSLKSQKRDEFNASFHWVQGKFHNPVKGNKDWLRYVFERFFALEVFLMQQNIRSFWHFDSDTMIMMNLNHFEDELTNSNYDCTTLCNDACPSGYIRQELVSQYCTSIIEDYHDSKFLDMQQKEFDELHNYYAFTEMRAFQNFKRKKPTLQTPSLPLLFQKNNVWFDECICQSHDFECFTSVKQYFKKLKNLYSAGGIIYCKKKGVNPPVAFATINCSWVTDDVFLWIQNAAITSTPSKKHYLKHALRFSLKDIFHYFNNLCVKFFEIILKFLTC
ncbi:hypothetical protein [Cyanobium sp. HWJ4-Hawea]|uniref:hypothetical protein n=1 Tax=Cyanobium sp. HWJ4-Hawea TaxID=2823713 RepID=UPI0020CE1EB4|nr:hypothetical protein [Cyanobium sp. HWJ4-Hawea]